MSERRSDPREFRAMFGKGTCAHWSESHPCRDDCKDCDIDRLTARAEKAERKLAELYKNAEIRGCENNRLSDQVAGLQRKLAERRRLEGSDG